ncbi:MAG: hypothetical protein ACO2ZM_06925 [Francisellaceae bacterium]
MTVKCWNCDKKIDVLKNDKKWYVQCKINGTGEDLVAPGRLAALQEAARQRAIDKFDFKDPESLNGVGKVIKVCCIGHGKIVCDTCIVKAGTAPTINSKRVQNDPVRRAIRTEIHKTHPVMDNLTLKFNERKPFARIHSICENHELVLCQLQINPSFGYKPIQVSFPAKKWTRTIHLPNFIIQDSMSPMAKARKVWDLYIGAYIGYQSMSNGSTGGSEARVYSDVFQIRRHAPAGSMLEYAHFHVTPTRGGYTGLGGNERVFYNYDQANDKFTFSDIAYDVLRR